MQVVLPSVELISLISDRVSFDFVIEVKVDNSNKITVKVPGASARIWYKESIQSQVTKLNSFLLTT